MKSRFILVLLLGALVIIAGLLLKFLDFKIGNPLLISGIFLEAIFGVLYALQISNSKVED